MSHTSLSARYLASVAHAALLRIEQGLVRDSRRKSFSEVFDRESCASHRIGDREIAVRNALSGGVPRVGARHVPDQAAIPQARLLAKDSCPRVVGGAEAEQGTQPAS